MRKCDARGRFVAVSTGLTMYERHITYFCIDCHKSLLNFETQSQGSCRVPIRPLLPLSGVSERLVAETWIPGKCIKRPITQRVRLFSHIGKLLLTRMTLIYDSHVLSLENRSQNGSPGVTHLNSTRPFTEGRRRPQTSPNIELRSACVHIL